MSFKEVKVLSTIPERSKSVGELEAGSLPRKTGLPKKPGLAKSPMSGGGDYVYVNSAFVGSVNSVNHGVNPSPNVVTGPPTSVIREQYWTCSKWPQGQKILAITVGVLVGTVIGLSIWLVILEIREDALGFLNS